MEMNCPHTDAGSCSFCYSALLTENKRLKFENDLLVEGRRRDGGLRDSESAYEDMVANRQESE